MHSDDELRAIYANTGTIAVVGASNDPAKPAYHIGRYLKSRGFRIVPVNPRGGDILGERAYSSLPEVDVPIDVVDVFRPAEEAPEIARQAAAAGAKVLWLQTGIASDEAARIADEAGMDVVMNTCMGENHARLGLGPGPYAPETARTLDVPTKRWTLVAVVLGSGVVFLDSTVVNVALPQIGRELPTRLFKLLEAQSYVYYGYLLTLSALLILAGAITDYYGRKRTFGIGLAGFAITSVLCGVAPNMELLVLFRVLQGAAGAVLVPGSLSIITSSFSGEEQGRAFGIWAGASAATTILGPILGGVVVTYVSWRAVFLLNVPLLAVALWATRAHVLETRDDEATSNFDWGGAILVALMVGGITFGTIRGQALQWQGAQAFVALGIGMAAAVWLPFQMARSTNPLIPPELFRSRNFTVTNISTLLIYGAIYVVFYLLSLFAIGVLGYNAVAFGVAGLPAMTFLALFSTRFGTLAVRYGPRLFMAAGPALMGAALLLLARVPADSAPWVIEARRVSSFIPSRGYVVDLLPALALFGIGLMIMVAPLTAALMRSVPERNAGVASAVNNAISRVGPQLAGALLFVAITGTFYGAISDRVPGVDVSSPSFRERVSPLNPPPGGTSPPLASAAREGSTKAFHLAMLIAGMLCLAGALVNALGIRNPAPEPGAAPAICCPGCATPAVEAMGPAPSPEPAPS